MTVPAPLSASELDALSKHTVKAKRDGFCVMVQADFLFRLIAEVQEHRARSTLVPASGGVVVPQAALAAVQSTQAMRDQARELAKDGDDYDRVFMMVLDDLERFVPNAYPAGITKADHIAHDMKVGRFPKQSSIADFLVERAAAAVAREDGEG